MRPAKFRRCDILWLIYFFEPLKSCSRDEVLKLLFFLHGKKIPKSCHNISLGIFTQREWQAARLFLKNFLPELCNSKAGRAIQIVMNLLDANNGEFRGIIEGSLHHDVADAARRYLAKHHRRYLSGAVEVTPISKRKKK